MLSTGRLSSEEETLSLSADFFSTLSFGKMPSETDVAPKAVSARVGMGWKSLSEPIGLKAYAKSTLGARFSLNAQS